jgi:RND family efflux transporter MFP subunit
MKATRRRSRLPLTCGQKSVGCVYWERIHAMKRWMSRLAVLCLVSLLAGCSLLPSSRQRTTQGRTATPTPLPTPVVPVDPTYTVQRGQVVRQMVFSGRVAPVNEQELFFRAAGRVRQVLVKRDDMVKKGQLLADLENDALERSLTVAKLELERAQAKLQTAQDDRTANIKRAQLNLDVAKLNLDAARVIDPAPRKVQAQVALEKTRIALEQAQAAYDKIAYRSDRGATAESAALQQATLDHQEAQAAYDLAMQAINGNQYQVALQERQVALAQLNLDQANRPVDPLVENDVKGAQLDVDKIQASISEASLTAPFDGKVLSLSIESGTAVEAFKAVATVADPVALEVTADMVDSQLRDLAEGMTVTLVAQNSPGEEIKGSIRRLPYPYGGGSSKVEEQDKSTRVSVDPAALGAKLSMGDLVRVTAVLESRDNVLWLPPQAVREFEGRKFVVVQEGDVQRRVDVKTGLISDERVEIQEGLTEGQIVSTQ